MEDNAPPKKKKIVHSSQRTMERMRKLGFTCIGKTEKWVPMPYMPGGGKRFDLWGWVDVLACGPDQLWYAVQSCAMSGRAAHVDKLRGDDVAPNIAAWLACPWHRAEIWSWRLLKSKRGGVAVKWEVDRLDLRQYIAPLGSPSGVGEVRPPAVAGSLFDDQELR